jgi:hypothetical protein
MRLLQEMKLVRTQRNRQLVLPHADQDALDAVAGRVLELHATSLQIEQVTP